MRRCTLEMYRARRQTSSGPRASSEAVTTRGDTLPRTLRNQLVDRLEALARARLRLTALRTLLPTKTLWPSEHRSPIRAPAQTCTECQMRVASPICTPGSMMARAWIAAETGSRGSQGHRSARRDGGAARALRQRLGSPTLEKSGELFNADPGLTQDRPQRARIEFLVIGDDELRETLATPDHDMGAVLSFRIEADLAERLHAVAARDPRELAQTATSSVRNCSSARVARPPRAPRYRRLWPP